MKAAKQLCFSSYWHVFKPDAQLQHVNAAGDGTVTMWKLQVELDYPVEETTFMCLHLPSHSFCHSSKVMAICSTSLVNIFTSWWSGTTHAQNYHGPNVPYPEATMCSQPGGTVYPLSPKNHDLWFGVADLESPIFSPKTWYLIVKILNTR